MQKRSDWPKLEVSVKGEIDESFGEEQHVNADEDPKRACADHLQVSGPSEAELRWLRGS